MVIHFFDVDRTYKAERHIVYSAIMKSPGPGEQAVHRASYSTGYFGFDDVCQSKGIQEQLQHNWHNIVLERKYVAVVEGVMEQPEEMVRSI